MDTKKIIIIAVVILLGGAAFWMSSNDSMMGDMAANNMAMGDMNSAKPLVEVTVPQLSPVAQKGEGLFNDNCAACHNTNAVGRDGVGPPLVHKIYEPSHHGDESFQLAAKNGVRSHHWPFGDMAPVEGITRADVSTIIAYVRELQRANGIN